MSALDLPPLVLPDFAAEATHDVEALGIRFSGQADMGTMEPLGAFLRRVHAEATKLGVGRAVVDLRAVEFMSSSCLKCFLTWLGLIEAMAEGTRYGVHFISNPAMHWQRRSLQALQHFSTGLVTIES